MIEQHYRIKEVVELTGIKRSTLYQHAKDGILEVKRPKPNLISIPESELNKYLERGDKKKKKKKSREVHTITNNEQSWKVV